MRKPSKSETEDVGKTEDELYGCLSFKPSCLQRLNTIRCHVICQCIFNFFEGFIVNGVINVVLVALEKRYFLSSSKSGLIASSNDIGAIVFVVLVGYFGEQRHKPKLMGTGVLLMIAGCFLFSLPHFIGDTYQYTLSSDTNANSTENMCQLDANKTDACEMTLHESISQSYTFYYALLMVGNMLLGIGASPMFTIGLSYIDENCKPKMTAFYISWTFCAAAIGVAVGYVVGGQTLSLFVDIDKLDSASITLTPMSPQWVGAWWIAPLIALLGFIFVAIPIYGYPKRLPSYAEVQKSRTSEAHGGGDLIAAQVNFGKSWRDFPKSVWLLVTNPTYVFICFGAAVESLIIGGMATFGAKLIQEKFNLDITYAGSIMGVITIPGSGGGMLLGGYLVKRFKLKCRGIIRMCACFMLVAFCFGPLMLVHCTNDPVAGLDHPYLVENSLSSLVSKCNEGCGCTTQGYEPLCVDSVVYFSPCHAGCLPSPSTDDQKVYDTCTCIANGTLSSVISTVAPLPSIQAGLCSGSCPWLYVFCALFLVVMVLTFATMSPGVTALFRCVPDKQRSVGIGVNLLFVRLVGMMPGPILLGAIIDSTCTVWQTSCGTQGSCWVYDKHTMGIRLLLWFMGLKICGFVLFVIASLVYKAAPGEENTIKETTDSSMARTDSVADSVHEQFSKL